MAGQSRTATLIAGAAVVASMTVGSPIAVAEPPGPALTFLPFPLGIKVNISDKSGTASTCTYTSDWFTAPPFFLGANDTFPLILPHIQDNHEWSVDVDCDNGAHTHTTYRADGQSSSADGSTEISTGPTDVPRPGPVRTVTDSTFADQVLNAPRRVLVAFQKPTCTDCVNFDPVLSDVAAEGLIDIFTLDAEQNPSTPEQYGIITPPCPDCGTYISPLVVVFDKGGSSRRSRSRTQTGRCSPSSN